MPTYDTDEIYADGICEACLGLLSKAPVIVTLNYLGDPLHLHKECYEAIAALLPPPPDLTSTLEVKARLGQLQAILRGSAPGGMPPQ